MKQYDYLIVGAGLFGAVFAQQATKAGKSCLVIDKRDHIAGNIYTENVEGINVHRYGAHIFHTNNKEVWDYVNQFAVFNRYTNSPVANYKGELYNLPFNMNTFNKMWGVVTPAEAEAKIEEQRAAHFTAEPKNLEEQAINLVGTDIYEKLVKHYTEKQWGRPCTELPAFIIKRLPVRLIFDNNYFNALYQGIPNGGYTQMVANMLQGVEVRLGVNYLANKAELDALADRVIYTGPIDAYFDYSLGTLQYRSVRFETETLACPNYQGNAVINYTDAETPYTRIIEHKHFEFGSTEPGTKTVISREYSAEWKPGDEPYYPVNDDKNSALYAKYKALADAEPHVVFGGRLGEYKYYDMDKVIESALACVAVQMDKINQYKAEGRRKPGFIAKPHDSKYRCGGNDAVQFEIKDKAMTELSVSILSADLANLAAETADSMVCGADMVHFDVMDGHFVPNITYGAPVLKCLKKAVPEAFYDVHLMISDPARYAQDFAAAGANLINFHIEAVPNHVGQTIAAVRETGCLVGLTISPSTPPQAVFPYLDELDLVLVMGVEPGFGGQKFIPTTVSRVAAIKAECNRRGVSPHIEVDGGINTETASLCAQAGASVLVMGSAFFKAQDRAALAKQVRAL